MQQQPINTAALRQRFSPDGSPLRRQQLRMLELLKAVDDICRRHHISYWLSSGTLLGAVRHGGFIPWDDDLDIEMMRPDYLRLMEVLPQELPPTMALQEHSTDPNYFFCYAKVRDRRSLMRENNDYDRMWREKGIFIDVFPMERQRIWVHKLSEKTIGHIYKIWRTSNNPEAALRRVLAIYKANVQWLHPVFRLMNRMLGAHIITSGLGMPYHAKRYDTDIFPLAQMEFEGHSFPVPHDSHHYLATIYGDYMRLPDLDKLHLHVAELKFL